MGVFIHWITSGASGNEDPYKKVKSKFNQFALELYTELTIILDTSSN